MRHGGARFNGAAKAETVRQCASGRKGYIRPPSAAWPRAARGCAGKLVTIVDVVDQNRCVVYGPTSGVARQMIGYKRLSLTDLKIAIGRGARKGSVEKAWTEFDVEGKWAATGWGKKQAARKAKASSNDFEPRGTPNLRVDRASRPRWQTAIVSVGVPVRLGRSSRLRCRRVHSPQEESHAHQRQATSVAAFATLVVALRSNPAAAMAAALRGR